jgi:hypothetical protein
LLLTAAVVPHGRKVVKIYFCSSVGHVGSNALDKRSGSGVFKNVGAHGAFIVKAQGQAGFTAMDFDKPKILEARLNSGKPRCPLVPCSVLLCFFLFIIGHLWQA